VGESSPAAHERVAERPASMKTVSPHAPAVIIFFISASSCTVTSMFLRLPRVRPMAAGHTGALRRAGALYHRTERNTIGPPVLDLFETSSLVWQRRASSIPGTSRILNSEFGILNSDAAVDNESVRARIVTCAIECLP